jgi:Holliday junction resolvase
MSESKLQAKILQWLKAEGHYAIKTIVCNKNGVPDILGCTKTGRFFAIEVKYGANKTSALQEWNIKCITNNGGLACVAYNLETVQEMLR